MVCPPCSCHDPSSRILDTLKNTDVPGRDTNEQRVAIVEASTSDCTCDLLSTLFGDSVADVSKSPNVIEGVCRDELDMTVEV